MDQVPTEGIDYLGIAQGRQTPFYVYDEARIRNTCRNFKEAFSWVTGRDDLSGFKNYFAVKATPTPEILKILREEGMGADCSSMAELILSDAMGFRGKDIMFTSNNTPCADYLKAQELGAIINLDDLTHVDFLYELNYPHLAMVDFISLRYNPGKERKGNVIIGQPEEAKFGMTADQIFVALRQLQSYGVREFGLHTMVISNCLELRELVATANMMFKMAARVYDELGISLKVLNLGGGIGIPYRPSESPIDIYALGAAVRGEYNEIIASRQMPPIRIIYECGRFVTGPYGALVTTVIHQKDTHKRFIGVDASMADLMRPGLYGAYHHIRLIRNPKPHGARLPRRRNCFSHIGDGPLTFDVVGGLCENNDKFAVDREFPEIPHIGDLMVVESAGAHGHSMGFNYNGKLRCAEYLLRSDGSVKMIRRAQTYEDYFATVALPEETTAKSSPPWIPLMLCFGFVAICYLVKHFFIHHPWAIL